MNSAKTNTVAKNENSVLDAQLERGLRMARTALAITFVFALVVVGIVPAQAQTEIVLYSFGAGQDAQHPNAGLVQDLQGNLYGTASAGGAADRGAVFRISPTGNENVLYSFATDPDGHLPEFALVRDSKGLLYGTTLIGGTSGRGIVFSVTPSGTEKVLHSFLGGADGTNPRGNLIRDAQGNLYGTTISGGAYDKGTVFRMTPTGATTILYNFSGVPDGAAPEAGLIRDAQGYLYGTTWIGGAYDLGTVFVISPTGGEKVLHSFRGSPDGSYPSGSLIQDVQGNLYGTTPGGGASGGGTVFKVSSTGPESVLHSFTGGADGLIPKSGLVQDTRGTQHGTVFYGTTAFGGANGGGTVYSITSTGAETVVYSFSGVPDGANPNASLIQDAQGNFYGTTTNGGASGRGTVFKVVP